MTIIFKYLLLTIICLLLLQFQTNAQEQSSKDTLTIDELKANILPTFLPLLSLEEKPLPRVIQSKYKMLMFPCLFTGTVLHQSGPSTFNTVWISGAGKNNKAITLKTLTDNEGKYKANLSPGKYNIKVYGPKGIVAKLTHQLDCKESILPKIKYEK